MNKLLFIILLLISACASKPTVYVELPEPGHVAQTMVQLVARCHGYRTGQLGPEHFSLVDKMQLAVANYDVKTCNYELPGQGNRYD